MKAFVAALLLLSVFGSSLQLYESGSKVVKLTAANFKEKVLSSSSVWLVEFYGRI